MQRFCFPKYILYYSLNGLKCSQKNTGTLCNFKKSIFYYGACFIALKRSIRDPGPEKDVREIGMAWWEDGGAQRQNNHACFALPPILYNMYT